MEKKSLKDTKEQWISGSDLMEMLGVLPSDYQQLRKIWTDYRRIVKNPDDLGYCPCWDLLEYDLDHKGRFYNPRSLNQKTLFKDTKGKIFEVITDRGDDFVDSLNLIHLEHPLDRVQILNPVTACPMSGFEVDDRFLESYGWKMLASHISDPNCEEVQKSRRSKWCLLHPLEIFNIPKIKLPRIWEEMTIAQDSGAIYDVGSNYFKRIIGCSGGRVCAIRIGNIPDKWADPCAFLCLERRYDSAGEIIFTDNDPKGMRLIYSPRTK
jgi:hypothetical protein